VLGALLLQADRATDAEAVYRADLKRFRDPVDPDFARAFRQ
jgi:hypothetical protein